MDQQPVQKKIGIVKKFFHYIFITWILQGMFDFYWCDKCQRLTRYDYQIRIQPTLDGKKAKMKIPYCTRCVTLEVSRKKSKIITPNRIKRNLKGHKDA